MKKHENQGCNIIAENTNESKSTVERLTAEELRKLTPTERIEYAKKLNGYQPKTTTKGLILDKSTTDKIDIERGVATETQRARVEIQKNTKKIDSLKEELKVKLETFNSLSKEEEELKSRKESLSNCINEYNTVANYKETKQSISKLFSVLTLKAETEETLKNVERKLQDISYDVEHYRNVCDEISKDILKLEKENKKLFQVNDSTKKKPGKKPGKKSKKAKAVEGIAKAETKKVNSFALALADFERMYIENGYKIPTTDETLYTLSKAVAFSVIKKLIEVSADKTMITLRGETVKNFALLDNLDKRTKTDTLSTFDSNGKIKCIVADKEYTKAVEKVLHDSMSQGVDVVHQASISILEEVATIQQKNGKKSLKVGFMLEPYESRKTNGKTFAINGKKSVEWETVEVLPIRNVFKSVRAYIQNNKSIKAVINGYSYIESLSIDNESDEVEKIYYRLNKYADLGEIVTDFNGKEVAYTTTAEEVEQYKKSLADLIIKAQLDQKHIDYINCRLSGKSLIEIAKYIGVSLRTATRIQQELQKKSIAVGYGDESMLPKAENTSKARPIKATDENGKKYTFESVKSASIQLNIDKSNITACLKGRLKKTKGYSFEYITE